MGKVKKENCLDCGERVVGCHSNCNTYKENKAKIDFKREKRKEFYNDELYLYKIESIRKAEISKR